MAKHELPFDQEFIEFVVRAICDYPDEVKTTRNVDEMGVLLTLKVNPSDMGKIIGKEGATAKALRTLLRVVGAKNRARINFKIEEPPGSTHARRFEQGSREGAPAAGASDLGDLDL